MKFKYKRVKKELRKFLWKFKNKIVYLQRNY